VLAQGKMGKVKKYFHLKKRSKSEAKWGQIDEK
jgi:hypothetical protein